MVKELSKLIDNFPGAPNCSHCFTHILNLAAKSVLFPFNSLTVESNITTLAVQELAKLSVDIEMEEKLMQEFESTDDNDNENGEDSIDGWVDETDKLEDYEKEDLFEASIPVQLMLVKVSHIL